MRCRGMPYLYKNLFHDIERFKFVKVGQVQLIVPYYNISHAVALGAGHSEEVHRGEVHPQQQADLACLVRLKPVVMERSSRSEACRAQVKPAAVSISVGVRVETEKPRKAHHEHDVEVGEAVSAAVKPFKTVLYESKGYAVGLLAARGVAQKFGNEQSHGQLHRVERYRRISHCHLCLFELKQINVAAHVDNGLYLCQRLEVLPFQLALARFAYRCYAREPSVLFGEHIDDNFRFAVLERVQYYRFRFYEHFLRKYAVFDAKIRILSLILGKNLENIWQIKIKLLPLHRLKHHDGPFVYRLGREIFIL